MIMVYYTGLGYSHRLPKQLDLSKEKIISWEIKKLKNWKSPNLIIIFENGRFEQPSGLISNYDSVVKYLKKIKL